MGILNSTCDLVARNEKKNRLVALEAEVKGLTRTFVAAGLALQAETAHTHAILVARCPVSAAAGVHTSLDLGVGALPASGRLSVLGIISLALTKRLLALTQSLLAFTQRLLALTQSLLALTQADVLVKSVHLAIPQLVPAGLLSVGNSGDGSKGNNGGDLHSV